MLGGYPKNVAVSWQESFVPNDSGSALLYFAAGFAKP